ncbi:unnamed protein product [Pleuronectes platessa]|uniref:Uncharacterized protein n=1 Tax=Pleuronectes platessa TaxID=8262 RepID=A0A9N7VV08_PLEPL|nr:unnamed protein product [Pleuronectes platessa]
MGGPAVGVFSSEGFVKFIERGLDEDLLMAVPFCKVTHASLLGARRAVTWVQIDGDDWWAAGRHPSGQTWMTEHDCSLGLGCSYPHVTAVSPRVMASSPLQRCLLEGSSTL